VEFVLKSLHNLRYWQPLVVIRFTIMGAVYSYGAQ